jgi:hypothetical protein
MSIDSTGGPRKGSDLEVADWCSWDEYVASWPSWRPETRCLGLCPRAHVCGRARVCLEAHAEAPALVLALARLSAAVGERPPKRVSLL